MTFAAHTVALFWTCRSHPNNELWMGSLGILKYLYDPYQTATFWLPSVFQCQNRCGAATAAASAGQMCAFLPSATDRLSVSRSGPQHIPLKETSEITAQIYLSCTLFSAQFSHNNVTFPLVPLHITPLVISPITSLLSPIVNVFLCPSPKRPNRLFDDNRSSVLGIRRPERDFYR